jgi:hypothetical protein
MSITASTIATLRPGQSVSPSVIIQDADGNSYAHASILNLYAIFTLVDAKGNERVLAQYSKNALTGYTLATQEDDVGKYSFKFERSETKLFPTEGDIYIEVTVELDSDVFAEDFFSIEKTQVFTLAPAWSKKIT